MEHSLLLQELLAFSLLIVWCGFSTKKRSRSRSRHRSSDRSEYEVFCYSHSEESSVIHI